MKASSLSLFLLALGSCLGVVPAVHAQGFAEVSVGWDRLSTASGTSGSRYDPAPYFRGSLGKNVAPHLRLRFDGETLLFRLRSVATLPCPYPECPTKTYDSHMRGAGAVTANALLSLDPGQVFYVLGGAGLYVKNAETSSLHAGGTVGVGAVLPEGKRMSPVIEVSWRGLAPQTNGPTWFVPVSLGLRF